MNDQRLPRREAVTATAPLHRVATPDDIAEAALGLIASRYATGATLIVDSAPGRGSRVVLDLPLRPA